jgi:Family of unknown function (DUF6132)
MSIKEDPPMYTRMLIGVTIGVIAGGVIGYFGQCSTGTCPLTSTWWRGAIYGGVMGLFFTISLGQSRP